MKRAELYRVHQPIRGGPKRSRVFVVVSRQVAVESKYSSFAGLSTPMLTDFVGRLDQVKLP